MTDIKQIQQKIAKIYRAIEEQPQIDIPLKLQVTEWVWFAKAYIAAAGIVEKEASQHWLPILQLTGQAVESSLKACLASANTRPPNEHDLVNLYRRSARLGFQLENSSIAAIVHLQHFYFKDLATGSKFKSRYPTNKNERLGGIVPKNEAFVSVVDSLIEQAESRCRDIST